MVYKRGLQFRRGFYEYYHNAEIAMKLFITIQILLVISYSFIQVSTSEVNEECVTEINCERAPDGNQLKRHPTDCRKSYKCVNGEARIYSCEANKYFIDDLQSCEVPEDTTCNVICIETETPEISPESRPEIHCDMNEYCKSNPTENHLKRHPTDCTKSFRCANGEARIYSCPSNQHFYADIQACDVPKDEECTIHALECTLTTTEAESTTTVIQPESRPEAHCDMNEYCKSNPTENSLKRHPTDCTKSFRCANGEARIYSCPSNQHFYADIQACDSPKNEECIIDALECTLTTTEAEIESTTTVIQPESRPEAHCDMNEYCKSNPTENSLKRHPTDCTKSFRCANGEARIYSCPSNQHFYADIQACDVPKDEECTIDALECTLTTTEAEIESTTAAIQPESRPEIHCDMKIYCKNGPTETTLKRHPTDCTKSFRCANGEARIYSCPPNQHFFTELQICDVPKTEQCEIEAIKCGNTATEAPIEITTIDIQPTPKPEDQCNINMHCKFSPNEDGFRRHPADCTKYYRCVDGYPIIYSCSMNQQFYTDSQMCHISNNQCNINCVHDTTEVETTTVIQTTTSIPTTTVIPTTTSIPTTTVIPTTTESQTTTESSDEDLECDISRCPDISFDEVAYLRHKDCTKYCLCHGSLIYTLSCGDMLHFNLDLKTCDWPNNAGCAK
ncbi:uncharacterized protein [Onthophagus taurus]|uniref:uncharacterized protein n=1 Tax=Onthophagus taurus TaxID=166361 RepID=UPI0039BE5D97